jgi:asparagine synthase (glutamine-hydrolysing)
MAGIFGGLNISKFSFKKENKLKFIQCLEGNYTYGRKFIDKFNDERFILETDSYICTFEGFLFDIEEYKTQKDLFLNELNFNNFKDFIKILDGSYTFSVYFKKERKIFLVSDHLSSMKLFYSKVNDTFIFSSNLFDITDYYKYNNNTLDIDLDGAYFFLGFGSIAGDKTLFNDISKLEPSTYLEFNISTKEINIIKYHTLDFTKNTSMKEEAIIDKYEELLSNAMNRIVHLNDKYKLETIAGLSGGLDSKSMVVMLKERLKKLTTYTFAQFGSSDQIIAQKVSSKLQTIHNFTSLDNGLCMKYNFEDVILQTNGMATISTLLHGYNSFININTEKFGLMVSGQIGDAIFGSHFICNKSLKEYITSKSHYGTVPEFIYKKIGFMDKLYKNYSDGQSEAYIYDGRISNGTIYGDIVSRNRIDTITPFYSKKLLDFTLSVEEKYRTDEYIYIKWFKKYHPKMLEFKWDKCNCLPTSFNTMKILKYVNSVKNAIKKRLKIKYDGMNPFDIWFRNDKEILINLDNFFVENIELLSFNKKLMDNTTRLFYSDLDRYKRNKFVVASLLLSLKLHKKDSK